jgi:hypothetical protein
MHEQYFDFEQHIDFEQYFDIQDRKEINIQSFLMIKILKIKESR